MTDRVALASAAAAAHYPLSIPAAEGVRLRDWVMRESASSTIEIGLAYGVSALFICDGLAHAGSREARHVAIDPNQGGTFEDAGLRLLSEAGVRDMVEFIGEPSEIALPRLLAQGRRFDFGFLDGNHRFDWVFVDLVYLGRLLRQGGVIFVDDYQLPAISKAARFFVANLGWHVEETATDDPVHSWVVLRTPDPPLERHFTDFVDF